MFFDVRNFSLRNLRKTCTYQLTLSKILANYKRDQIEAAFEFNAIAQKIRLNKVRSRTRIEAAIKNWIQTKVEFCP